MPVTRWRPHAKITYLYTLAFVPAILILYLYRQRLQAWAC